MKEKKLKEGLEIEKERKEKERKRKRFVHFIKPKENRWDIWNVQ